MLKHTKIPSTFLKTVSNSSISFVPKKRTVSAARDDLLKSSVELLYRPDVFWHTHEMLLTPDVAQLRQE